MFRTSCLGASPAWARTWTSLTSPSGVVTTRAESIPSRLVSRFSARRTPQGSGIDVWARRCVPGRGGPCGLALQGRSEVASRGDRVATQRAVARLHSGHGHCARHSILRRRG